MAWCICSQSSLLNIYFRVSGFQSSVLLILFNYAPNTCSTCGTEPIPYVTLQSEIAPLLKSHRNHCSCVWTVALYSMVLAPAQKLSGIVWTWPYSHILAKRYGMISFIFGSNTKDTRWHSNNQQVKQSISKVCTVHVFSTWSLRLRQTFQQTQRPL